MDVETRQKLHATVKMIQSWPPQRSQVDNTTAHLICLVEEVGEVIDQHMSGDVLTELADVVIAANMVHLTLNGTTVKPFWPFPPDQQDSMLGRLAQLSAATASAASMWRKVSGMRLRASKQPATASDLCKQLSKVVGWAYAVNPAMPLNALVREKLDEILERGANLSVKEAPVHTGAKPGTLHWG